MSVRIKICGITNPADAALTASLGADMIGLNFYAQSPRFINEAAARLIVQALPASVEPVALFVNESIIHAQRVAQLLNIWTVQLHGDLDTTLAAGMRYIPAFPVRDTSSVRQITSCLERLASDGAVPHAILIDAHVPGKFGGTGQTAPWHLLADFQPGVPIILAGGLTPENVGEAIRIVRPWAVDVASGVESSPGKKDADKMRRFIEAARTASG